MQWKKLLLLTLCAGLLAAPALAGPSAKRSGNTVQITEGLTPEVISAIKEEEGKISDKSQMGFTLKNATDADVAKLCELYPDMASLNLEGKDYSDLSPVASLKKLSQFRTRNSRIKDFSPLRGLTGMKVLNISAEAMGPDLRWMSGMSQLTSITITAGKNLVSFEGIPSLPNLTRASFDMGEPKDLTPLVTALPGLKELHLKYATLSDLAPLAKLADLEVLDFYGARLSSFAPLAGCPKLRKLDYYATKDADYSTLGELTQVSVLEGGLTKLEDISWLAKLPNLKEFRLFAEAVADYSPLAQTKLEKLFIWSMKKPVDLAPVGKIATLKGLKLWSVENVSGSQELANLTNLEKLEISGWEEKSRTALDLAFLKKLSKLVNLNIQKTTLTTLDPVALCQSLESVRVTQVSGLTSLAPLKKLPKLKNIEVSKGAFAEAELTGFAPSVKVAQR